MRILVRRDDRAITNINVRDDGGWETDYVDLFDIPDSERPKFNQNAHYHLGADNQTVEVTPVTLPAEEVSPEQQPYDEIVAKLEAITGSGEVTADALVDLARITRSLTWVMRDQLRADWSARVPQEDPPNG